MSLVKSLNRKFFLQNIKKNIGFFSLGFLVMIASNILSMLAILHTNKNNRNCIELDISTISMVINYGMYIIPIILSILLYEMVYKKKSVDFINSMPITRKTFFLTNNIGGIFVIITFIFVNTVTIFIMGNMEEKINVSIITCVKYFILWSVMYICIFEIANLAMSCAGNKVTQIIVTLLIFFFVQFFYVYYLHILYRGVSEPFWSNGSLIIDNKDYLAENFTKINNGYEVEGYVYKIYKPASPLFAFASVGCSEYIVDGKIDFITAIVVSIVCFVLGYFLYQTKKMEDCENSFKNIHVHNTIKCLTLLPLLIRTFDVCYFERKWSGFSLFIFYMSLCAAYFIIYDLITKKRIERLKLLIGYFSITCLIAFIILKVFYKMPIFNYNILNVNDFEKINLCTGKEYGEIIADEKIKKIILKSMTNTDRIENGLEKQMDSIDITIELKNKDNIYASVWLDKDEVKEISDYIVKEADFSYTKDMLKMVNNISIEGINGGIDKEDEQELIGTINNNIDKFLKKNIKILYNNNNGTDNLYTYESLEKKLGYSAIYLDYNKYMNDITLDSYEGILPIYSKNNYYDDFELEIYPALNDELYQKVLRVYNKFFFKDKQNIYDNICAQKETLNDEIYYYGNETESTYNLNIMCGASSKTNMFYNKDYGEYITFLYKNCYKEFEKYIICNYNKQFDADESYVVFQYSTITEYQIDNGEKDIDELINDMFFSNNVKDIKKLIEECQNKVVTLKEYDKSYDKIYNDIITKLNKLEG